MIWQVYFGKNQSHWVNTDAPTPQLAACQVVAEIERNHNTFRVGCGGESWTLRVVGTTGEHVVVVHGRMAPTYEGELQ